MQQASFVFTARGDIHRHAKRKHRARVSLTAGLWTLAILAAPLCPAQTANEALQGLEVRDESPFAPDQLFIQASAGESTQAMTGGVQWELGQRSIRDGAVSIAVYLETTFGRWRSETRQRTFNSWSSQITLSPAARISKRDGPWFLDVGVGPSWITPLFQNDQKHFSTTFNFRSHLGFGRVLGNSRRHSVDLRVEHYSNAGIRRPNPGVNLIGLRYVRALGGQ
jgi:hypothetical protein